MACKRINYTHSLHRPNLVNCKAEERIRHVLHLRNCDFRFYTYVNEAALTGTYADMIALFNNYEAFTGTAESCGQPCRDEEDAFLEAILSTGPIQLAHDWLVSQGSLHTLT